MKTKRTFVLVIAFVLGAVLLAVAFPGHRHFQVRGSLSKDDLRAITQELDRLRWEALRVSVSRLNFRDFWILVKDDFRLELVSIEGDGNHAIAKYQDHSKRQMVGCELMNNCGRWSAQKAFANYEYISKL